jgi:hypothetical protein
LTVHPPGGVIASTRRNCCYRLVSLNIPDAVFSEDGMKVTLRRSKTDQEGRGRSVGIPYGSNPQLCPVRSLRRWLDAAGITEGPL